MKPIKNKTLSMIVVEEILSNIKSGELKPGSSLPPQRELAKELKVGRSSVREALQSLKLINIIETRAGKNSIISNNTKSSLLSPIKFLATNKSYGLSDLLEFRVTLEQQIVKIALLKVKKKDLQNLKKIISAMQSCIDKNDMKLFILEDYKFHEKLARATNNNVIIDIFDSITEFIRKIYYIVEEEILKKMAPVLIKVHKDIYEAVVARDSKGAEKAVTEHFNLVLQEIKKLNDKKVD